MQRILLEVSMFDKILKFIFPCRCVVCDTVLPYGDKLENEYLCTECRKKVEFIKEPTCKKCGAMMYDVEDILCTRCHLNERKNYEFGFGLCRYNDAVKESLHRIKYGGRKEYLKFYGKCIARVHNKTFKELNIDCMVPVPIHRTRFIERGYNQASILAKAIRKELLLYNIDIPVYENLIFRDKKTKVLNKLDENMREKELAFAFSVENCENMENIMIIDDIYTTGATIDKIAECLKLAGAKHIYFCAIAIVDNM